MLLSCFELYPQVNYQVLKGTVTDKETREALPGANIVVRNAVVLSGAISDASGSFRIEVPVGRISIDVSFVGYEPITISDILVGSGKEVFVAVEMRESYISTSEVVVRGTRDVRESVNQMATVSTHTVRTDDALRFAGGFYDPSRIVNGFAGVVTANNDESNDIVIRGNSSRGLLWRLEGIEIPNPNHFGDGQGGSGGAYSAITSNVISSFDFFTGAFPAEYGNAVSGVMDLSLRKGNTSKREYAFQTGMIGLELAAEGPIGAGMKSSYLVNARYVNFGYLEKLGIIDLGSTNFAPRSADMVFNFSFPDKGKGSYNIFGFFGSSAIGKKAVKDKNIWKSDSDRWEEIEQQSSSVAGVKYVRPLPSASGFVRIIGAFTGFTDRYSEGYVDSSYLLNESYHHNYEYPSLRLSFMLNNKLSSNDIIRTGINLQFLGASMEQWRRKGGGERENLVEPSAFGLLYQFYVQIRNRLTERLELNTGIHTMAFSINKDIALEPRLSLKWRMSRIISVDAGAGLHSRIEAMPVYFNLIRDWRGRYSVMNDDLEFSRSFQQVFGVDIGVSPDIRLRLEAYNQHLFSVPVIDDPSSTYSSINTSEELPSSDLASKGIGYNRGIELSFEKQFSRKYYFLITASLFDSKYKPGDKIWYNTYYNNSYVANIIAGKDFITDNSGRNIFGINVKSVFRGGYRYTPVDYEKSAAANRVVYMQGETYGRRLPDFFRIDGGVSFRRNGKGISWILMADVQNFTARKNIFRRKYSYTNGNVVENNVVSLGAIPVGNFRIEF